MLIKAEAHPADIEAIHGELPDRGDTPPPSGINSGFLSVCAPYLYLTGAFATLFATLYVSEWFWILPHSVLLSAATVHLVIALKRKLVSKATKIRH